MICSEINSIIIYYSSITLAIKVAVWALNRFVLVLQAQLAGLASANCAVSGQIWADTYSIVLLQQVPNFVLCSLSFLGSSKQIVQDPFRLQGYYRHAHMSAPAFLMRWR